MKICEFISEEQLPDDWDLSGYWITDDGELLTIS